MKNTTLLAGFAVAFATAIATAQTPLSLDSLSGSGNNSINNKFKDSRLETTNDRYIIRFKQPTAANNKAANAKNSQTAGVFNQQGFSSARATDLVGALGGQVIHALPSISGMAARLNPQQLEQLKSDPQVQDVELDPLRSTQANGTPYGIGLVQADLLSDAAVGNQKVCVIDTGYDINHEDLMSGANVTGEVSNTLTGTVDLGEWSTDVYGHGTHVAGTISALNNSTGTDGVNPNGLINLHIVKVIHKTNYWEYWGSDVIDAVNRCQAAGATVINMSLAGSKSSAAEEAAINNAYNNGVLLVSASGNRGSSAYYYPASYDSVISVGAIDSAEQPWVYTQTNDQVELVAPGVEVNSTLPNNRYGKMDGTSAATPYVSGVAALVWSHHPECNNAEIRNILHQTAKDLGNAGRDSITGFGLIQAKDALDLIDLGGCDGIINNPPTIIGVPPTSVNEDEFYQFSPVIADEDQDDTLTISIDNQPSWASFDSQTGELSGTPINADVGFYNGVIITVKDDSDASASTTPFSIEVVNVNDAPVISTVPDTSATQDIDYQYIIAADDDDLNTTLAYSAPTLPSWLTFNPSTKTLSGTPLNANVGSHSVKLQVSDGEAIVNQDFTIIVANVNDAPIIDGNPANSVNENRSYVFTPTATDPDDDSLTYSISGKPSWAIFNTTNGQLSGTPGGGGNASFDNIVISVDDGSLTDSLTFSITVVASVYSEWTNAGARTDQTNWTPVAANQTTDFTQSFDFKQNQSRTEQQQQLNAGGSIVNVGSPIVHTQVIDDTQSRTIIVSPSIWTNDGAHYECGSWSPDPSTVDFATEFTQTRACKQDQQRTWGYTADSSSIHSRIEAKTISENETQTAIGSKQNWVDTSSTFTAWTDSGSRHTFGSWVVAASTQTANFTQNRSYKQAQTRNEQPRETDTISEMIRNKGAAIPRSQTINGSESRAVTVTVSSYSDTTRTAHSAWSPTPSSQTSNFSQSRTYTQNQTRTWTYKVGSTTLHTRAQTRAVANQSESRSVVVSWSSWIDSGVHHTCASWGPATNTIGYNVNFTQTRSCKQNQTRNRIYKAGSTTLTTQAESKVINENESRASKGVGNWTSHTSTFTAWVNNGARHTFGSWGPTASTQTASYTQNRTYKQKQVRDEQPRERDTISGTIRNKGTAIGREQTINGAESRPITVTVSGYSNTTRTAHTAWSPTPTTQTSNFSQSRTYTQNQTRTWTYKAGSITLHTRAQTRAVANQSESRSVAVSWSSWIDSGVHHTCASWGPATNTIGYNVNFTQTRSCKQNQTRNRIYKAGSTTLTTQAESKVINENESRASKGVGNWTSHTSTFTAWVNNGARHTFGSWGPTASTQTASYTQNRTYKQKQVRDEQPRERDTISGTIRNKGTAIGREQTINGAESRPITVTVSGYSNTTRTAHTAWSPTPTTQTSNFSQSRTYTQNQTRTWTYRAGSSTLHTRAQTRAVANQSESRTVIVTVSNWGNSGGVYQCSGWSPSPSMVEYGESFSQSRSCKQNQQRTWSYTASSANIDSRTESRTVNTSQSQNATGTMMHWVSYPSTFTSWTNDGGRYGYSGWTPGFSTQTSGFTQTRSYSQDQTRFEQKRQRETHTNQIRNTGSPIKRDRTVTGSESRGIDIDYSNWVDNGGHYSCGSWAPPANTINEGKSFTQARSCKQNQTRTKYYRSSGSVKHNVTESRVLSESESRSATGTCPPQYSSWIASAPNYDYSSWSPTAANQTSNFSQSRSYKQRQIRTKTLCDNSKTTETRIITDTESRSISVSVTPWSYGTTVQQCTNWSPATDMVNQGTPFEQTGDCKVYRGRGWSYKAGSTTIHTRTDLELVDTTSTREAIGTKVLPPSTPSLSSSNGYGCSKNLSWSASSGTSISYQVFVNGSYNRATSGTSTTLSSGGGYAQIKACNSSGCSGFSNLASIYNSNCPWQN